MTDESRYKTKCVQLSEDNAELQAEIVRLRGELEELKVLFNKMCDMHSQQCDKTIEQADLLIKLCDERDQFRALAVEMRAFIGSVAPSWLPEEIRNERRRMSIKVDELLGGG